MDILCRPESRHNAAAAGAVGPDGVFSVNVNTRRDADLGAFIDSFAFACSQGPKRDVLAFIAKLLRVGTTSDLSALKLLGTSNRSRSSNVESCSKALLFALISASRAPQEHVPLHKDRIGGLVLRAYFTKLLYYLPDGRSAHEGLRAAMSTPLIRSALSAETEDQLEEVLESIRNALSELQRANEKDEPTRNRWRTAVWSDLCNMCRDIADSLKFCSSVIRRAGQQHMLSSVINPLSKISQIVPCVDILVALACTDGPMRVMLSRAQPSPLEWLPPPPAADQIVKITKASYDDCFHDKSWDTFRDRLFKAGLRGDSPMYRDVDLKRPDFLTLRLSLFVHCECQLLTRFLREAADGSLFPHIGCTKRPCYPCANIFSLQLTGDTQDDARRRRPVCTVQRSHERAYPLWLYPQLPRAYGTRDKFAEDLVSNLKADILYHFEWFDQSRITVL
ncbi:hypothetical protein K466DRAFT_597563 [Polyporus arcularius HHB13444]|uniref:Uncharacterized protein n=1 Tax=Polyporus arcularius HHB13444 TaxID=1314778 RepID=A0A5C3PNB2_9APHY|nr:hypothetical protein K466DRAFT_597563 [Polyporus arcularius HHB13444]